jgi:hypothetical protein
VTLAPWLECFDQLRCLSDMLQTKSHHIAPDLSRVVQRHHVMFLKCYPTLAKQKVHYVSHIPRCIARAKKVLTCFSAEAQHKFPKGIMQHAYKHSTFTALSYELHRMRHATTKTTTFCATFLAGRILPVYEIDAGLLAVLPRGVGIRNVSVSRRIVHTRGTFQAKQLLCWVEGRNVNVGKARLFISMECDGSMAHLAWLESYPSVVDEKGRRLWSPTESTQVIVSTDLILRALPHVQVGKHILVSMPMYLHDR